MRIGRLFGYTGSSLAVDAPPLTVDVCGLSLTWLAGRCHYPVPEEDYDRCVLLSCDQ